MKKKFKAGGFTFEKVTALEAKLVNEALNGDIQAAEYLAHAYASGETEGIVKDFKKARQYLRMLIEKNSESAASYHLNIGLCYLGEHKDEKALKYFENSAKLGSVSGISQFTFVVLKELVFKTYEASENREYNFDNIRKMTRFLRKANKEDTQKIMQSLTERGITIDKVIKVLEDIGSGQHAKEQLIIAIDLRTTAWRLASAFFRETPELIKSADTKRQESTTTLYKLAKSGNRFEQYNLGWCLEHGVGFAQNINLAKNWYRKSAEQGLPEAQERMKAFDEVESVATLTKGLNL